MKINFNVFLGLVLTVFSTNLMAQYDSVVGTLSGTFSIAPSGAATYTIPIDVPKGRAGMRPELSFIYNNQQGSNLMGQGWNITGFSSITRTNPTTHYNGEIDNIDFIDDQLLLDGKILIEVGEENGNKIYRTEIDEISKIIYRQGTWGYYFEVYTKSGLIKQYGNTSDSRQTYNPQSKDKSVDLPFIWHMNQISDRKGNTITYAYWKDESKGELHPYKISYTGTSNNRQDNTLGDYMINFIYDEYNETIEGDTNLKKRLYFENDSEKYLIRNCHLLKMVKITDNASPEPNGIREYELAYYQDKGVTEEYFLQSITLWAPSKVGGKQFNSTNFEWEFYEPDFVSEYLDENFETNRILFSPVFLNRIDIDGDGRDEVLEFKEKFNEELDADWKVYIHKIYNPTQKIIIDVKGTLNYNEISGVKLSAVDLNNDGADELLIGDEDGIKIYTFEMTGGQWEAIIVYENVNYFNPVGGDFNGDRLSDCLLVKVSQATLFIGTGTFENCFLEENAPILLIPENSEIASLRDFNGDGKTDILLRDDNNNLTIYTYMPGTGFEILSQLSGLTNTGVLYYDDFNSDGKTDICHWIIYEDDVDTIRIYFSFGDGFDADLPGIPPIDFNNSSRYPLVADMNNDGRADFSFIFHGYSYPSSYITITTFYTQPDGLHHVENVSENLDVLNDIGSPYTAGYVDVNGDGFKELTVEFRKPISGGGGLPHDILTLYVFRNAQGTSPNVIKTISNGFGVTTNIDYQLFNTSFSSSVYSYPLSKFINNAWLAKEVYLDNGNGHKLNNKSFHFMDPVQHKTGKGFLGFEEVKIVNYQNNTETISEQEIFENNIFQLYPKTVIKKSLSSESKLEGQVLSETTSNFDIKYTVEGNNMIYLPVITDRLSKTWDNDANHSFIRTQKTIQLIQDIDEYGNSLKQTTLVDPSNLNMSAPNTEYDFKTTVNNSYLIDETNWLMGRTDFTEIIKSIVNETDDVVQTNYYYYEESENEWPLLKYRKITPNNDHSYVTEAWFEYDIYGNITKDSLKAPNFNQGPTSPMERVTEYEYSIDNGYNARFLTKKINTINEVIYENVYQYDIISGNLIKEIDHAGLETTYEYDDFGRLMKTVYPNQISYETYYTWAVGDPDAPGDAIYRVSTMKKSPAPESIDFDKQYTFFNKFQQERRSVIWGLQNMKIYVDKEYYSEDGRLSRISEPYFSTNAADLWTEFFYDDLGRILQKNVPVPQKNITITYQGRITTSTNTLTGVYLKETENALGKTVIIEDPMGTINYDYLSSGNVESIVAIGVETTFEYDALGNKKRMNDPNAGTIVYLYNPFGELIEQTDNESNTFQMTYDHLGRLQSKLLVNNDDLTDYVYNDSGGNGLGMISRIDGPDGISYGYEYDNLNRLILETETIEGVDYTTRYQYNQLGKIDLYTYPSNFAIRYNYDENGYLEIIEDASSNQRIWTVMNANARGQITQYCLGNGLITNKNFDEQGFPQSIKTGNIQNLAYDFDPVTGNLNYRIDSLFNCEEHFGYDNTIKTRLEWWQVNGLQRYDAGYEDNGNIKNKSDVTQPETTGEYKYETAGPHAVTSITTPTNEYLASAFPQSINYTAFKKIETITQIFDVSDNIDTYKLHVVYGPDNARKKTSLSLNDVIFKTKLFIGNNYEIEINSSGPERKLHYISGGDGIFAIFEQEGTKNIMYYIHKDYLGSYYCVTSDNGIVFEYNNVEQIYSFDPWGRRRNHTDWSYDNVPTTFLFDRGFTSHEHLDLFALINMNGRVYDPMLGRFLSPDPIVQGLNNSQNFNRYSYALNNPLKFIDPTGYTHGPPFDFKMGRGNYAWAQQGMNFQIGHRGSIMYGGNGNYDTFANSNSSFNNEGGSNNSCGTQTVYEVEVTDSKTGEKITILIIVVESTTSENVEEEGGGNPDNPPGEGAQSEEGDGSIYSVAFPIALTAAAIDGPIPIGDVVGALILAGVTTYDATQRTFVTYTMRNAAGQVYVGRTSGYGDPYRIMIRRSSGHHMRVLGFGNPVLDRAIQGYQGYPAIRGREQQLIDFYGGVGSPNVGNIIRGVSQYNLAGMLYHGASDLYFGPLAPYTGF